MENHASAAFADSKPHYELLDGLRGVAALVVIWYHVFEGFATSPVDQRFNHGYLAVDFFFILSGFVVGYAYDDRWKRRALTLTDFIKRRLIRLHPMVVLGAVLGAVTFCLQGSVQWDGTPVSFSSVLLALLLGLFLIPALPGSAPEVRGNGEMYPLNGPTWSLFFEYIGNLCYALFLRRLPTRWLAGFVTLTGAGLAAFAVGNGSGYGHLGVGWSLADHNLVGGSLRLLFAFPMGLLLSRVFRPVAVRGAFWICSLAIVGLLSVPYVGDGTVPWMNGLYDTVCVLVLFPLLVWLGASGRATDRKTSGICKFLGDISYPVYVIHYPFMYLFYAWLWRGDAIPFAEAWPVAAGLFVGSILLAWMVLKVYDEPVRRWLTRRFLQRR
ncbi:acyltransferase [uncultured Alistipes sp.]|uniref:acyltransferase family protein n=1 Tax=uncultured Alistipes sp. TaxID=538949 RepID=UPI003208D711